MGDEIACEPSSGGGGGYQQREQRRELARRVVADKPDGEDECGKCDEHQR
jgi:hypothetical protein